MPGYSTVPENLPFLLLSPHPAPECKPGLSHKEFLMRAGNPEPGEETASVGFSSINWVLRSRHADGSWRTSPDLQWRKWLQPAFPGQRFPLKSMGNSFHRIEQEQEKELFLPASSHIMLRLLKGEQSRCNSSIQLGRLVNHGVASGRSSTT